MEDPHDLVNMTVPAGILFIYHPVQRLKSVGMGKYDGHIRGGSDFMLNPRPDLD
jgi:hypothetical protein